MPTVGPAGGTVASGDAQLKLEFPRGALRQEVAVTVSRVDADDSEWVVAYEVAPGGLPLRAPAAVSYRVLDSGVDIERACLVGFKHDRWTGLPDQVLVPHERRVVASTLVLVDYAVRARAD